MQPQPYCVVNVAAPAATEETNSYVHASHNKRSINLLKYIKKNSYGKRFFSKFIIKNCIYYIFMSLKQLAGFYVYFFRCFCSQCFNITTKISGINEKERRTDGQTFIFRFYYLYILSPTNGWSFLLFNST